MTKQVGIKARFQCNVRGKRCPRQVWAWGTSDHNHIWAHLLEWALLPYSHATTEGRMAQGKGLPSRKSMYPERTPLVLSSLSGPAGEAHVALSGPAKLSPALDLTPGPLCRPTPHAGPRGGELSPLCLGSKKSSAVQFNQGPLASGQHWISMDKAALWPLLATLYLSTGCTEGTVPTIITNKPTTPQETDAQYSFCLKTVVSWMVARKTYVLRNLWMWPYLEEGSLRIQLS